MIAVAERVVKWSRGESNPRPLECDSDFGDAKRRGCALNALETAPSAARGVQSWTGVGKRTAPEQPQVESGLTRSYSGLHTQPMKAVRRTISMPASLARRLDREAKRRRTSFSALVAELVEHVPAELSYAGAVEDDPDLSLRVDEVLSRLAG